MANTMDVTLHNWALDDDEMKEGTIILRGVLDKDSLANLQVDSYQREAGKDKQLTSLMDAFRAGDRVPDIEVGMRGQRFREGADKTLVLRDPIYIIDGLQRVTAAKKVLEFLPEANIKIGVAVRFNSNQDWEKERFEILNTKRRAVSPNIMLRNNKEQYRSIMTMYGMSRKGNDKETQIAGRVCWQQSAARDNLLTALTLCKTACRLHMHKGPGSVSRPEDVMRSLEVIGESIKINVMRKNMVTFFNLVEECWGITDIKYRTQCAHMRDGFLVTLARLLSRHKEFWTGNNNAELVIEAKWRKIFAKFDMKDPNIRNLTAAGGKARDILYSTLLNHITSDGRRTKLTPWDYSADSVHVEPNKTSRRRLTSEELDASL